MKTFLTSSFFILASSLLFAFGPGEWNPGGGGQQPGGGNPPDIPGGGGGGNQPDQPGGGVGEQPGGGNSFIYDTFITDSTGVGIDVLNGIWISTDRATTHIASNSNLLQMAVGAAAGSTVLTNVDLRASTALGEIPSCAFAGCENLETVILPMSVTNIASDAFIGCLKFGSVSYGDGSVDPGTPGEGGEGGGETPPDQPGEGGEGGGETPPDKPGDGGEGGGETPDEPDEPGPVPEPEPAAYEIGFECDTVEATEGSNLVIRVKGGCTNVASSVKLYLCYLTASASDLNLGKASVDGIQKKLAFPLVLTWNAGEVSIHEISIPVKTDSSKEVDEQLTFQLAAETGCDLGRTSICTAILHDAKGSSTSALPLAYGIAEPADAGRVTGATRKAAGKSVTLTAAANSGYVFAGWYPADAIETIASTCLSLNPKYSFVMGTEDVALRAKFIAQSNDVAAIVAQLPDEMTNGVTSVNVQVDVSGCTSLPTVKVTGLPTGLKFTAKNIVDNKTKAVTVPANSIYGTPTKSGVYTVAASVTTAGKKTASVSQTVVVRKVGENVVKAEVTLIDAIGTIASTEAEPGKVTGMGVYAKGKTVTLKATANSGYVFAGWYPADAIETIASTCLTQTASLKFTMPGEDVRYTARFVTKDADAAAIFCALDGCDLSAEESMSVSNTCGVRLSYPIAASGLSKVSVSASGLPTGLKLVCDKATGSYSVAGIPTVASKTNSRTGLVTPSTTKFTVTSAGKSKRTFVVNWTIGALPAVTVGTWNGIAEIVGEDESVTPVGNFTMTATTAGSVSAKAVTEVGTASFSGKGWIEDEDGILWMAMTNKTFGVLCVRLDSQTEWTEDSVSASITGGKFGDEILEISAYRNPYGKTGKVVENADAQNALLDVVGTWSVNVTGPNGEDLSGTAKILNTGRVTVTGKLANGKTSYSMSGVLEVRRSEEALVPSIRLAGVTRYGCLECDEAVPLSPGL